MHAWTHHLVPMALVFGVGLLAFVDARFAVSTGELQQALLDRTPLLPSIATAGRSAAAAMIVLALATLLLHARPRIWQRAGLALAGTVTLVAVATLAEGLVHPFEDVEVLAWPAPSFAAAGGLALLGVVALLPGSRTPVIPALQDFILFPAATPRTILALGSCLICVLGAVVIWFVPEPRLLPLPVLYLSVFFTALACALAWHYLHIHPARQFSLATNSVLETLAVTITDIEGRIQYWSTGCEALYGIPASAAIGRKKRELTGAKGELDDVCRRIQQGEIVETELTEFHHDGYAMHIREHSQLLYRGNSQSPVALLTMTDISAAQSARIERPNPGFSLEPGGPPVRFGIIEWFAESDSLSLHGPIEQIFGSPIPKVLEGMAHLRDELERRTGFTLPHCDNWVDGQHDFVLESSPSFPYRTLAGTTLVRGSRANGDLHATIIIKDTTDRQRSFQQLRAREAELRTIADTVPEAFITMDARGHVRSFSGTAERLFGYPAAEVVGKDIRLILPDYGRDAARSPGTGTGTGTGTAKGLAAPRRATRARDRAGQELPVELSVGTAEIGHEKISIVFIRNLRERLAAQARIGQLREQFERVSRASELGELSAMLAHELNQPLSASANFLSAIKLLAERDGLPGSIHELAELTHREVLRASDIVQGIRQFITGGEFTFEAIAIDDLVRLAPRPNISSLDFQLAAGPQTRVEADPTQIGQVIVNLVTNAIQARHSGPNSRHCITISTFPPCGGFVRVRVEDNGPGFPPGYVTNPIEPFRTEKESGMGLGLSYCRRVIAAHGGAMTLTNLPGSGARVEFTLRTSRSSESCKIRENAA
ncbi:PAS domain S-box protein [Novosphingobium profundi]|uniref:PAS domain S-box protein n=1 Tax=Novosphingobium profundi TaxID=1774954 RepID=UPI001BDB4A16|nr:PAS domain S-box protein [Novosphingobium profundi]MBT0670560.1 PAS domain S-box protein [Novosphingobium profundi]